MKKFKNLICGILLVFGISEIAGATLIDRGGGLIYDDDLGITWLQDANYAATELTDAYVAEIIATVVEVTGHTLTADDFLKSGGNYTGQMTWWGAMAWADQLVYQGYSDWRLPDSHNQDGSGPDFGYNVIGSEMGHLYHTEGITYGNSSPFSNLQNQHYKSSTEGSNPDTTYLYYFGYGFQSTAIKSSSHFAWAVRTGDSAPIPEPATLLLMGSGLIGLAGFRRKKFKE